MTEGNRTCGGGGAPPFAIGNPGRPKGSRNRIHLLVEKLMTDDVEAIVAAVKRAAASGDMVATKIVLDRISPARKGAPVKLGLPSLSDASAAEILSALGQVTDAVAAGELSPEEGAAIAGVMNAQLGAITTVDLEARLRRLEEIPPAGENPWAPRQLT